MRNITSAAQVFAVMFMLRHDIDQAHALEASTMDEVRATLAVELRDCDVPQLITIGMKVTDGDDPVRDALVAVIDEMRGMAKSPEWDVIMHGRRFFS